MRTLGFRSLVHVFADLPPVPAAPEEPFTVAKLQEAVRDLEANATPPVACSRCGAGFYLLHNPSASAPATHWQCECGRIERLAPWRRGERQVIATAMRGSDMPR